MELFSGFFFSLPFGALQLDFRAFSSLSALLVTLHLFGFSLFLGLIIFFIAHHLRNHLEPSGVGSPPGGGPTDSCSILGFDATDSAAPVQGVPGFGRGLPRKDPVHSATASPFALAMASAFILAMISFQSFDLCHLPFPSSSSSFFLVNVWIWLISRSAIWTSLSFPASSRLDFLESFGVLQYFALLQPSRACAFLSLRELARAALHL